MLTLWSSPDADQSKSGYIMTLASYGNVAPTSGSKTDSLEHFTTALCVLYFCPSVFVSWQILLSPVVTFISPLAPDSAVRKGRQSRAKVSEFNKQPNV